MKENPPIIHLLEKMLNEYTDCNGKLNVQISFDADLSESSKKLISYAILLNEILATFSSNETALRKDLLSMENPAANFDNLMSMLFLVTNMYALQALSSLAIMDRKRTIVDPLSGHGGFNLFNSN